MRGLVAMALASLLIVGVSAASEADASIKRFTKIEAQGLEPALKAFARERGLQLVYRSEVVGAMRTVGVSGEMTVDEALGRLLKGTGLGYEYVDEQTVTIVPLATEPTKREGNAVIRSSSAGEYENGVVKVPSATTGSEVRLERPYRIAQAETSNEGQHTTEDESAESELQTVNVFGTLKNTLSVGSKSGESLREVPKSVALVTRERIEAQNLNSLLEALKQTTGVTVSAYTSVSAFYMSRGFRVQTMQFDGGAPVYEGGYGQVLTPDTAAYDHIEMLRGVDGMYTGAGMPGGIINLVRKRAKATPEIQASLSMGRWNLYRGEVDATGPLTDDGRLRGRVVGAHENKGYFYDGADSAKTILFGTVDYDLTSSTLLVAGASYERRKEDGYFTWGFPTYSDGRDLELPRSTAWNPRWAHYYLTTKEAFARVEQRYGENGVLKLNLTRLAQESENRSFSTFGAVDPVTLTGTVAYGLASDADSVQSLADLSASGTFQLLGREHRYTVGADYSKVDNGGYKSYSMGAYDYPGPPINAFNFDRTAYPEVTPVLNGYYPEQGPTQHGFYTAIGLQLAEPLRLTLGGRYGRYRFLQELQRVQSNGDLGPSSTTRYEDSVFIPSAALSWNFTRDWTAYTSYAESFEVQTNLLQAPLPGTPLGPITGEGYELGVKGEVMSLLNVATAIYRVRRSGQAVSDPAYPSTPGSLGATCCYIALADVISEGLDVEASGIVRPGLQLFAGYTYNRTEYSGVSAPGLTNPARFFGWTPKHMFKMWTTWRLPQSLSRWTVNAGVTAQSDVSGLSTSPVRVTQGGYAIWNASIGYQINDNFSVGLYGDNLFDKHYYQLVSNTGRENVYGVPRSYVLTLRSRW